MSLNCGCPVATALTTIVDDGCLENIGQIQKVIFQRVFSSPGSINEITGAATEAGWTAALASTTSGKAVVSPYLSAPTTEPGAARVYGGGNATVGGIEMVVGANPTSFNAMFLGAKQSSVVKVLKGYMCEVMGVYLVNEYGKIIGNTASVAANLQPIPIYRMFVCDKKLGGLEEPDSNLMEWHFAPNWSDNLKVISPTDFNPLTDLVNP